jgi:Planctomycete cytochrome C/Leucine Rich repeat
MSHRLFCSASFALTLASLATPTVAAPQFEQEIWPILKTKCVECHRATYEENGRKKEPKAGLRLDGAWAILKGSENGPVLTPKDSTKSYLYEVTTLPEDDDMFMPPKGDPLTDAEKALLKAWIDAGADFGGWEGNTEGKPADAAQKEAVRVRDHETFYAKLSEGAAPASDEVMAKAKAAGAQLFQLKADAPLLRADFLTGVSSCDDAKLEVLIPLKEQLAQIDLGRTAITDVGLKVIASFPRLALLDLRQTKVTDAGLAHLAKSTHLRSLNLYGTEVSDAGLKHLHGLKGLRNVYLWQTKATEAGAKQLAAAVPGLNVSVK